MKCAVKNLVLVSFSVAFLASYTAYSQEILLKKDDVAKSEAESKEGWTQFANLSLGLSSGSQKDVVGSTDGFSSTQTAKLEAQNNFLDGSSDWRNSLTLNLGQSKTPALPKFVKSTDILSIESLYMWHVPSFPEIGPYAKLTVETQALDSYDVRAGVVTYQKYDSKSGATLGPAISDDKLKMSESFKPMTLKESLGLFYTPYKQDYLSVEIQLGAGARQTLAEKQFILADDVTTPEIEVFSLMDRNELGSEGQIQLSGSLDDKRVTYKLMSNVFAPFQRSDENAADKDKSSWEKRSYEYSAMLSFKTYEWLSFDYLYKGVRNYSLSPKIQRTDSLMMSVNYTLVGEAPKKG